MSLIQNARTEGEWVDRIIEILDSLKPDQMAGDDLRGWEWYYLARLYDQRGFQTKGHDASITSITFPLDSRSVISASYDGVIKVWDLTTKGTARAILNHGRAVVSMAVSPDGRTLAAGSDDGTIALWDLASGQKKGSLAIRSGHRRVVQIGGGFRQGTLVWVGEAVAERTNAEACALEPPIQTECS
jgi:WD40 repeat protein